MCKKLVLLGSAGIRFFKIAGVHGAQPITSAGNRAKLMVMQSGFENFARCRNFEMGPIVATSFWMPELTRFALAALGSKAFPLPVERRVSVGLCPSGRGLYMSRIGEP